MTPGYLSIETHEAHRESIRFVLTPQAPDVEPTRHDVRRIRYVAHFHDSEAALMHSHEILKRHLLDRDAHLYRFPLERAIAAVESLGLRHRRIYLDPDLSDAAHTAIASFTAQYRRRRQRRDSFFQTVGYLALLLLLLNLFLLSAA